MDLKLLKISFFSAIAFSYSFAADIQYSPNGENKIGTNWFAQWADTASWVGGVVPTANDTAILNSDFFSGRNYGYIQTVKDTVLAKNLIVNIHDTNGITFNTNTSVANDIYTVTDVGGTIRFNAATDLATINIGNNLYVGRGMADSEGNYTVSSRTSSTNIGYFDKYVATFTSVTVQNDVVIAGKTGISTYLNIGAKTFTVNGVVDMQFSGANFGLCIISSDRTDAANRTTTVNLGGIKGVGNLLSGNSATNGAIATSNINITGAGTNSWAGIVKNNATSVFNVSHTGTGTQTLAPTSGYFDAVSVSSGVLKMGTTSQNGSLLLSGGAFGAVTSVAFGTVTVSGGKLLYNAESFLGGTADLITVSGKFTKSLSDKIAIDFSGLDAESILDVTYDLLTAGSYEGLSTDNDADSYFTATNLKNALANFDWKGITLTVTFTTVPEPSSIALIFGFLAAAIILFRRRK